MGSLTVLGGEVCFEGTQSRPVAVPVFALRQAAPRQRLLPERSGYRTRQEQRPG